MPTIGPYRFSDTDALRTFSNLGMWWHHLTDGIDPNPVEHDGRTLADDLARALALSLPVETAVADQLELLGQRAAEQFSGAASSDSATAALTVVWTGLRSAMATLRSQQCVATNGSGVVEQINVSNGGVPKQPVDRVDVDFGGIVGDRQGSRQHHGRPWQALSIWSGEVIDAFAAAGNALRAGSAGENLTIRGIDWTLMRPGMHLRIGTVLAETTSWAIPCRHNAQWFANGDFRQMSHERGAVSRIYATVLAPGEINTGDSVTVQA